MDDALFTSPEEVIHFIDSPLSVTPVDVTRLARSLIAAWESNEQLQAEKIAAESVQKETIQKHMLELQAAIMEHIQGTK